jgi:hypothetical protein
MTDPSSSLDVWTKDRIEWQEIAPDGTRYSLLSGRRDVPDQPFVYAFFIPAGFWDPAHWHTQTARVRVLEGTLFLGYGEVFDPAALVAHAAGSEVVVPALGRHFDGSDVDTLIVGASVGVWATHYINPEHRPSAGTPD